MAETQTSWLPGKKDSIRLIPMQMDILPEGRLVLDFDGVGEWGWHPFNPTPKGLYGALSISVVQTLSYDGRANLGSLLPCEIKTPPVDSLFNPSQIKKLATGNPWPAIIDVFSLWVRHAGDCLLHAWVQGRDLQLDLQLRLAAGRFRPVRRSSVP